MDAALVKLLRSLQTSAAYDDALRLLPTATALLTRLSNPLNITLLASQILSSVSLYPHPVDLPACRRIFSVFYTAAIRFAEAEQTDELEPNRSILSRTSWVRAVVKGADENSPRWRHTLLIGGILLGFDGTKNRELPDQLRQKLEEALVTASNLALSEPDVGDPNSHLCIVWVLNVMFPHLSDHNRAFLDYDVLLPQLVDATFFSREGLEHGYWLGVIDTDIRQIPGEKFSWSLKSPSGLKVQEIRSRSLTSSLGPLSRLIAHSLDHVHEARQILTVFERLTEFARNLALSWRQNKFSELDPSEEDVYLDTDTFQNSLPVLLQILRDTLFATVICLRSAIGRLLTDSVLSSDYRAPILATRCLHILRDTYFIAHRFGQTSSSQYAFVNLAAIDILNKYPQQAEQFLTSIRPIQSGHVPVHPLDRIYDLYFLNLAEHFTLTLNPKANEELLLHAAMAYITTTGDKRLSELYEAAHSVLLAVFSAPQNAEISSIHIPFYVETLMDSFPNTLSPRQFRLAVKSVLQLASPPSPISMTVPLMQATILELLHERALHASEETLPPSDSTSRASVTISEKTVLLLSTMDCLPSVPVRLLEEWLPLTAEQLHRVKNPAQRELCQNRFWEVLSNGEMDVERAAACVAWWTSRGGRDLVVYGEAPEYHESFLMAGALSDGKPEL